MDKVLGAALGASAAAALYYAYRTAAPLIPIRSDWAAVSKGPNGRVSRSSFKAFCLKKHADKLTTASTPVFEAFLERVFDAGTGLMLMPGKPEKIDLGRHCFSYCNVLAGEFYFQQVRAQHTSASGARPALDARATTRHASASARTRQHAARSPALASHAACAAWQAPTAVRCSATRARGPLVRACA